ncbi:MAG: carboxylating nicotinate-nucleotide diphosphorylase [Thermoanaerobaculia bacterium]
MSAPDLVPPPATVWRPILERALAEDLGRAGDLTSAALIPAAAQAAARIIARRDGTIAGLAIACETFALVDPTVAVERVAADGERVAAGAVLARLAGPARALLAGERTCLNLLGRLCGIAGATRAMVDAVAGGRAAIVDTRKTTPGLRALEKYAVRCGGGRNHRFGLDDAVLVKDNHLAVVGSIAAAVARARAAVGHLVKIEVEVTDLAGLEAALAARADVVMLDNFDLATLRRAVDLAAGRVLLEASGGVTPDTVAEVAATGVDLVSVGWLTHSAPALDVALDFEPTRSPSR